MRQLAVARKQYSTRLTNENKQDMWTGTYFNLKLWQGQGRLDRGH